MKSVVVALSLLLCACANSPEAAHAPQLSPAAAAGRAFAIDHCGGCHALAPGQTSVDRRAPPLWTLAGRHTPGSLRAAVLEAPAHDPKAMPAVILTPAEASDILAYISATARTGGDRTAGVVRCIGLACVY